MRDVTHTLQRSVPISRFDDPRTPIPQKAQHRGDADDADVHDKPSSHGWQVAASRSKIGGYTRCLVRGPGHMLP